MVWNTVKHAFVPMFLQPSKSKCILNIRHLLFLIVFIKIKLVLSHFSYLRFRVVCFLYKAIIPNGQNAKTENIYPISSLKYFLLYSDHINAFSSVAFIDIEHLNKWKSSQVHVCWFSLLQVTVSLQLICPLRLSTFLVHHGITWLVEYSYLMA